MRRPILTEPCKPSKGIDIAAPFLRWAGSKRAHVAQLSDLLPTSFNRYFEPFLGSGSLYFHLEPQDATLGDRLSPLIITYRAVRDSPNAVFDQIARWRVDRETYYNVRELVPTNSVVAAARFIYLNKTAWNGLYRVNRQGRFNVPYGLPKSDNIVPRPTLIAASETMRSATFICDDFETTLARVAPGDLVFVDPPYVTSHNDNGFVEYNEKLFRWEDQVRLAELCRSLADQGVHVLATNAAHESVRALYKDFHVTEFSRHSTLAGKAENRKLVREVIFSTSEPRRD